MLPGVRKGSTSSEGGDGGESSTPNNPAMVLSKFKFRKSEDNLVEVFEDFLEDVPQIDKGRIMCVLLYDFCTGFVFVCFSF